MPPDRRSISAGWVALLLLAPASALAHGFAVRYDLPVPLGFFLAGAGATVVLTFLALALWARPRTSRPWKPSPRIVLPGAGRIVSNPWVAGALQITAVFFFVLVVAAGLFGDIDPYHNISTTFVWVIWWVGMMFVNTFIGDVWALANPWNIIFAWAEKIARAVKRNARLSLGLPYPQRLGSWPAVILFLAFAWLELTWGEGEDTQKLASVIIRYSLITWAAMVVFGRRPWLNYGEPFAVVFSTFARFAPLALGVVGHGRPRCDHGRETSMGVVVGCPACFEEAPAARRVIVLRAPGAGLLTQHPVSPSMAAMVLTLLATVTFDGFLTTPAWIAIHEYLQALPLLAPLWGAPWMTLKLKFYLLETPVLLLFPLIFAAAFLLCCRLTSRVAGGATTATVAGHFVLTLLPIAIAYHLAHYVVYLLLTGQFIIPTLSDPFGFGWDIFGTASYKADIGLIGAKFAWYTGVIAIVTGHLIAVYLAHRTALHLFSDGTRSARSELPMLALMVAYTMTSLWIIAQPTVQ
jgi:hypothetical protein